MLQHGGGYSYRMAPADGPLTEATFGKMPLDFVGNRYPQTASYTTLCAHGMGAAWSELCGFVWQHLALGRRPQFADHIQHDGERLGDQRRHHTIRQHVYEAYHI